MSADQQVKTSVQLAPEELRRPAQYVARYVARAHLAAVIAAAEKGIRHDRYALHDLRVALRRLRTCLDAYGIFLRDTVPKDIANKLHRLQASTNTARDVEVQYLWSRKHIRKQPDGANKYRSHLLRELRQQYDESLVDVDAKIRHKLPRVADRLNKALEYYRVSVDTEWRKDSSMALAMADALTISARTLYTRMTCVASADDVSHIHRTRIAAKHLRYLLEPLQDSYQAAHSAVDQLVALQDAMGELHDASILGLRLPRLEQSDFAQQVQTRLQVSREQYEAMNAGTVIDQVLVDVSDVITRLQIIEAKTNG